MPNKYQNISWAIILILFIVFFPAALVLMYKKLTADKTDLLKCKKVNNAYGWPFMGFYLFIMIFGSSGSENFGDWLSAAIILFLFFGLPGLIFLNRARVLKKCYSKYRVYLGVVGDNYITSIDDIAAAVPVSFEEAVRDLQNMIDKGFFGDAYINKVQRELIIPYRQKIYVVPDYAARVHERGGEPISLNKAPAMKVITCKSCGAKATVKEGTVTVCEYCGSPLM